MNASTTARTASDSGGGAVAWPAVSLQARLSRMAHDQVRMDDMCSNTPRFYDRAISPSYDRRFGLNLSESAQRELVEYLESL